MSVSQLVSVGGFSFSTSPAKSGGRCELLVWLESQGQCNGFAKPCQAGLSPRAGPPLTHFSLSTLSLSVFPSEHSWVPSSP